MQRYKKISDLPQGYGADLCVLPSAGALNIGENLSHLYEEKFRRGSAKAGPNGVDGRSPKLVQRLLHYRVHYRCATIPKLFAGALVLSSAGNILAIEAGMVSALELNIRSEIFYIDSDLNHCRRIYVAQLSILTRAKAGIPAPQCCMAVQVGSTILQMSGMRVPYCPANTIQARESCSAYTQI